MPGTNTSSGNFQLPVLCEFIHRGDGTYLVKPIKCLHEPSVTAAEAAELLKCDVTGVKRLIEEGLILAERPTPHVINVLLSSVLAHKQKSRNSEFWLNRPWLKRRSTKRPCKTLSL